MAETKVMLFHRRRDGVGVEEWDSVWRGECARRLVGLAGVRRVVQNVPRRGEIEARLDGIDEIYLGDAGASSQLEAGILGAVGLLRGCSAAGWPWGMLARERMQVPRTDAPTAVRRMAMVFKRRDLDPDTFEREWDGVHPRFVAPLNGLRGYLQSVHIGTVAGLPAPDGGSTLWWDSIEVCEAAYADQGRVGQAHEADMTRLFERGQPSGTYCDPFEIGI